MTGALNYHTLLQADSAVIALVGPTASGKTAGALALAKEMPCEIISVDSALIYKGMDIGTAKPTREEQQAVPHHLIDILDPAQSYSVAQFQSDVQSLVQQIRERKRVPLLVGGTMMYFKVLMDGLGDLPTSDPGIRAQLDSEIERHGIAHLHARLAKLDPVTAARLPPTDTQRIQRALEVIAQTGKPLSELFSQQRAKQSTTQATMKLRLLSLEPSDRSVLHQRIADRFEKMIEAGFMDEMQSLRVRGDLNLTMPSMRCVGYRQAWEYLDGKFDLNEFKERGIIATRQLAKRQLTWLRSMPNRKVFDCLSMDIGQQIIRHIKEI